MDAVSQITKIDVNVKTTTIDLTKSCIHAT